MKCFLILLLAGNGTRIYDSIHEKKQFVLVNDKPLFLYSLKSFIKSNIFSKYILVISSEDEEKVLHYLKKFKISLNDVEIIIGGKSRNESVLNGLNSLKDIASSDDKVFIHDAARPLIEQKTILSIYKKSIDLDALTPVIKITDSIIYKENRIEYVDRDKFYQVATPQVFKYQKIVESFSIYDDKATDDFSKILDISDKVDILLIPKITFKITTIDDLKLFKAIVNFKN